MLISIPDYRESFTITDADCDLHRRLTTGALLRMVQTIGTNHCTAANMNKEFYEATHTGWVVTRVATHFDRVPMIGETLELHTRPEAMKRAQMRRITIVYDETGEEIGVVDARWALIDTLNRRILRELPEAYQGIGYPETVDRELNVRIPKGIEREPVGSRIAHYSLCDFNGHINNTKYADVACDALPSELMEEHVVSDCVIHYRREIPFGTSFDLERSQLNPNQWYVAGSQDTKHAFEATLTLQRIDS